MEKENKVKVDCGGDQEKLVGQIVRIEHWATWVVLCEVQVFGQSFLKLLPFKLLTLFWGITLGTKFETEYKYLQSLA